ncbi:MAG: hypothetical protein F4X98_07045 [Gammaproteobacteria bacterium]|nr:hypothetical protein [Gammaproteobacteria bacterium]
MAFRRFLTLIRTSLPGCFLAALTFAALATACGAEPQQMAQPFEARPTPTPDSAPTPTPAVSSGPHSTATPSPTPTPTHPSPEPPSVPITDWNLDASSTGSDFLALLSQDGRSCIQSALGDRFSIFQAEAFIEYLDATTEPVMGECFTPENKAGIAISMFSATADGLSAETRSCLADVFTRNPQEAIGFATSGPPSDDARAAAFEALSCLSPEEAAAITPEGEGPPPDTAALRCLAEELMKVEGGDEILRILSTADPAGLTLEQSTLLGQAVSNCGIDTHFTFPEPTSSQDGSASTDGGTGAPSP